MKYTGTCNFNPSQNIILHVVNPKMLIDLDISAKVSGKFSYRVTDSDLLQKAFGYDISLASSRAEYEAKLCDTVLNALIPQVAKLDLDGISPDALKAKNFGLAEGVCQALSDYFVNDSAVEINSFEITEITYDEDDMRVLDSCIYRYNSMAEADSMIKKMKADNTMPSKEKALDDVLAKTQDILKFYSNKF